MRGVARASVGLKAETGEAMLKIYHAPATRAFRVIWVCEELHIPYEIVPVDFSPAYRATPEWRAMNPVGKVPVMTDGALKMFDPAP